mmetsp:Transcript_21654/g.56524  ORF Transcript_21654/g.56524 Transcript_21654/m.56524 type:complete len:426 (-) Transcript_21654:242-1519(-)|eukprot:CAMPEP_0182931698 /NCGR_PEP_ID=MMETSP0105_2-20130417/29162_1 /TAXON_ID=81532 ORGANISM="Acanthoeca-like sp., Strain 10tr" /NCGR_SAMPLE_ID=MMETSP0105_2 /ASSEMBLY_ACC=CAM_ASM_000205 /LENGTH=425 /DNA_ID=CAMNT_0025070183 /DNA_START=163 /DNA_END=1440 /DNA_ORIENTATION=+
MAKKKPSKLEKAKQASGMNAKKPNVDKTFGMKNKKGKKAQQVVAQQNAGAMAAADRRREEQRKLKAAQEAERKMMGELFKPAPKTKKQIAKELQQKITGLQKSAKKDIYSDERDEKEQDTMDGWDQEKLEEVVKQKHGKEKNAATTTTIICRHFLKAVENNKYGWFWICPAGDKACKYRHALPPGYVLKRDQKKAEEEEKISMEQLVEEERQALLKGLKPGQTLTKVTEESFKAWKKKKILEKKMAARKEEKKKRKEAAAGNLGGLSGRDLFAMGQARDADADAGDGGGGGDGFDLAALRAQTEAETAAAEEAAKEAAGEGNDEGGAAAPADGGKGAMKVDESLFAMDLGDLDSAFEEMLAAEGNGGPAAAAAAATDDAASTARDPPAAAAAAADADGNAVAVDASLFEGADLAGLDIDGLDDGE